MVRTVKISADISAEAKKLLDRLCVKHDRSRGYLLDRMIKHHAQPEDKPKAKRATTKKPPGNWQDCFDRLWEAKGKRGSKKNALEKWRRLAIGETPEDLEAVTAGLVQHMRDSWAEVGFPELHLTTYLNQERWQK